MRESLGFNIWLGLCCAMVLGMVLIGGITRLTNSGLSITEWRPVTGVIPPIGEKAWRIEKEKYEGTPEYLHVTSGISMRDFKHIYIIEYVHRLLGRVLGVVFLVPLVYFSIKRRINGALAIRICIVSIFGMSQGIMGWLMVKSGLIDVPHVSHYRLAVHLLLAVMIFAILWYSFLESMGIRPSHEVSVGRYICLILTITVTCLQIVLGALVAGLDAGLIFNTFPLMGDTVIPEEVLSGQLLNGKFLSSDIVVQFLHRVGAAVLVVVSIIVAILIKRPVSIVLCACIAVQFTMGVATLIHKVPIHLASIHQMLGFVIIAVEIYLIRIVKIYKDYTIENYVK